MTKRRMDAIVPDCRFAKQCMAACQCQDPAACRNAQQTRALFVYGILRSSQPSFEIIHSFQPTLIAPAVARGRLIDLGSFPGLVEYEPIYFENDKNEVHGELVTFAGDADWESLLQQLDELEGFSGWGESPNMYDRVLGVVTCGGECHWAWLYLYALPYENGRWIVSGDWLNR